MTRRGRQPADTAELRRLREAIDGVDRRIVDLVNERAELTRAVGAEKARAGRPIRDAAREREVLLRVSIANRGPTPQADLLALYRRVIAIARGLEGRERERLLHDEPEPPGRGEPPVA
ncbi:MAG TPA: chorismate mutase [Candidatus Binatus sp.]|nr:chorismate mutase [Candidatus Binatus sp.]